VERPLVSVLLASYNHEHYVEQAVRSIMAQKGVSFELVVIDDGSSDNSPQILQHLAEEMHFAFVSRPNKGLVATLNEMLAIARGKYFCSFASDDIMPQFRLKKQTDFLEEHPERPACFGQVVNMDENGNLEKKKDPRYTPGVPEVSFEDLIFGKKELHGCSEMLCTDVFKNLGGYTDKIKTEDFAMFCALASRYGSLPVLNDVCCYYRLHRNNMHLKSDLIYPETIKTIQLYASPRLAKVAVAKWKAYWFSHLAYTNKLSAIRMLPHLISTSFEFWKRLPKLFIPKCFLKY